MSLATEAKQRRKSVEKPKAKSKKAANRQKKDKTDKNGKIINMC